MPEERGGWAGWQEDRLYDNVGDENEGLFSF